MNAENIIRQYSEGFASSPIEVSEKEIQFLLQKECKCDYCWESILDQYDFPELFIEEHALYCEECYDREFRAICPICEDSYDIKDGESEYSVLIEEDAKEQSREPGIYKADSLVIPIRINHLKMVKVGMGFTPVYSDDICSGCVCNLVKKSHYISAHGLGTPCILIKRYENDPMFKDWSKETFKLKRIHLIHRRITYRGIIERANNYLNQKHK